ncbi:MAG: alpha/beta hydrolase, partial [Alphaproteobacteria bacterium]|nr:alpha/beta hydrolase [Alphaproteobacteria bacterium]
MLPAMEDVRDELIEMRGLRFHYRDWTARRSGAPDLVLLHGYTGHARSWDHFANAMSERYRVLALDQRGHGETGWAPADRYGVGEMADDLASFVRALGLKNFALLGLSMGGMVAIEYAGRKPEELARLVIVDIGPEIVRSGSERIRAGVAESDIFESRDAAFAAARRANPVPPEAHHRHRVETNLMRTEDGRYTWRYDRALRRPDSLRIRDADAGWKSCAAIAVPTLVIRGARSDILSPETAARMIQTIPDAKLVTVENSGHAVPLDSPDGFLK